MRRSASFVLACLLVFPLLPVQIVSAEEPPLPLSVITAHSKELLSQAQAEGRASVVILVTTVPQRANSVASDLRGLGATILSIDDPLGYVSASIATGRVADASRLPNVQIVDLDEVIPLELPSAEGGDLQVDPPGAGTPGENPYMPTRDIGSPQFVTANPTFDGRGTTIGIVDTGIDLLTPELQTTTTGERKIVDWMTFTHPLVDQDPTWVNMATTITVTGGAFTVGTQTYTGLGAADGTYRFGTFNEDSLGATSEFRACTAPVRADLNRNGVCSQVFAVVWDGKDTVWIDSNADRIFAGEAGMSEYRHKFDTGTFGTDNPATPIRESVPFVVQVDETNGFVNIGIVSGAHGTHVAGIAAGKDFFGGVFDGGAPGAKLVSVRVCLFVAGCTARALIDGMIYVAKNARADVINMSIGGLPFVNDGNNTRARVYNRLIEHEKVQMFISAGNSGPGMNTVGDPSVASLVMSVGSYIHRDTWLSNYGASARKEDGLHVFTSRGPREDGGLKPQIVAPGAAVSTIPKWQAGAPVTAGTPAAPIYPLPPGYGMFNGTSMASPQAAGGAALLVSAAKQSGTQYQPDQLRLAINSSSRYLPFYGAIEQGNGLMSVGASWALLRQNLRTVEIESAVPLHNALSGLLATPNVGIGIYDKEALDRGGVTAGDSYTRTYTFTRKSGGRSASYDVSWVGNDGTFSSATSISLPLNTPTAFTVGIAPASMGAHSALLRLDDPATPGVDYQTMNTVIASELLTAANEFTVNATGSADRPDAAKPSHFFNVPSGATGMRMTSTPTNGGRIRTIRFHPYGVPFDSTTTTVYCGPPDTGTGCPGGVATRTVANPTPGIWEITVDTSRASLVDPATYLLRVELFGVSVTPSSWTIDPAAVGTSYTQEFEFRNQGAPFTGNASGTSLTSAFAEEGSMSKGSGSLSQDIRWVRAPAGATTLTVQTRQGSDTSADLDVFVFYCGTDGTTCGAAPVGQGIGATTNENVIIASPPPGVYKVVVEEFSIPAGTTTYGYLDEVARNGYGSITVVDAPAQRASGATWSASAVANLQSSPADAQFDTSDAATQRFLRGFVQVTSAGSVLGSAEARFHAP